MAEEDIFPKLLDTKSLMDCQFGELVMEECFGSVDILVSEF